MAYTSPARRWVHSTCLGGRLFVSEKDVTPTEMDFTGSPHLCFYDEGNDQQGKERERKISKSMN